MASRASPETELHTVRYASLMRTSTVQHSNLHAKNNKRTVIALSTCQWLEMLDGRMVAEVQPPGLPWHTRRTQGII